MSESAEWVQCKGQPYPITRDVCKARQQRKEKACKRCPERGPQMYLFESPLQVAEAGKSKPRRRTTRSRRKSLAAS